MSEIDPIQEGGRQLTEMLNSLAYGLRAPGESDRDFGRLGTPGGYYLIEEEASIKISSFAQPPRLIEPCREWIEGITGSFLITDLQKPHVIKGGINSGQGMGDYNKRPDLHYPDGMKLEGQGVLFTITPSPDALQRIDAAYVEWTEAGKSTVILSTPNKEVEKFSARQIAASRQNRDNNPEGVAEAITKQLDESPMLRYGRFPDENHIIATHVSRTGVITIDLSPDGLNSLGVQKKSVTNEPENIQALANELRQSFEAAGLIDKDNPGSLVLRNTNTDKPKPNAILRLFSRTPSGAPDRVIEDSSKCQFTGEEYMRLTIPTGQSPSTIDDRLSQVVENLEAKRNTIQKRAQAAVETIITSLLPDHIFGTPYRTNVSLLNVPADKVEKVMQALNDKLSGAVVEVRGDKTKPEVEVTISAGTPWQMEEICSNFDNINNAHMKVDNATLTPGIDIGGSAVSPGSVMRKRGKSP